MKSIANQYRDLREGKMTQSNFMRNLRMSMPQYITNVTSFNDAVKILKNKAILTEAEINELSPQTKYNAAMKAVDRGWSSGNSDSNYKKAISQGNKFIEEIDPVLKKTVEDFGTSLGLQTNISKGTTGFQFEPIVKITMGKDLKNPEIKVIITKYSDKIEGSLPDENAERRLSNLIKQIQKKELDVELKETLNENNRAFDVAKALRDKYKMDAEGIYVYLIDDMGLDNMTAQSVVDQLFGGDGEEDEMSDLINKIGQEEEEEKAIKGGFGIYDPMEEDQELNEYEQTYRKIDGVCYRIDDEGNRTRVADHYCRYSEDLNEAKKKKEPKKELHPNQIHPQELRMGIKVELEHTDDLDKAKKIALDHLAENPFYYTALKLSGIESPSAPKVKAPVEKKARKKKEAVELVDKANAMQKVKLKEEIDPEIEGKPSQAYLDFLARKKQGENVMQATNADGVKFSVNDRAVAPDGKEIKITGFTTGKDGKMKAMYSAGMFADVYNLDDLKKKPSFRPGVDLGASFEKFKSTLEALVREVVNETFDGRDNLANITDDTK
jgi:hypothetical protein